MLKTKLKGLPSDQIKGYQAYLGYLYLEHTHSNPVLVTFCRLLLMVIKRKTELSRSPELFELQDDEG